ncbi:WD domain G-beta repeat/Anaphase-promoting complex subunit 4 WD40 domain/Utp13 specific WD40 associated domain containing protein [Lotmaria passim]
MQVEGKNCFRTRWTQEPIFSGGALASLALPAPPSSVTAAATLSSSSPASSETFDECLVMACGDAVNVVRASTGAVLCSYSLPVEDVILHVDAVTVPASAAVGPAPATDANAEKASAGNEGAARTSKKKQAESAVKTEAAAADDGDDAAVKASAKVAAGAAELRAPEGHYIAVGTRGLQIYVLRVGVQVEPSGGAEAQAPQENEEGEPEGVKAKQEENEDEKEAKEGEEGREEVKAGEEAATLPVVRYSVELLRNWTAAQHAISVVHFSQSGTYLISGATDGSVKVWNVFHHYLTHNLVCPHTSLVQSVCLDAEEAYLAVGSFEGHVTVFDFVTKKLIAAGRPHVQAVESIAFSEHRTHVYSIARDRRLALSQLMSLEQRHSAELRETRAIVVKEHVSAAVFEGTALLHVGAMDGVVSTYCLSETEAVQLVRRLPKPPAASAEDGAEESFVRALLVAGAPKGAAYRTLRGFQVHETPNEPAQSRLYVGDAGFNIQFIIPSSTELTAYTAERTLVGFLDQILDVKLFPTSSPLHRAVVTNSKEVRLYTSEGCVSSRTLRGHGDIVLSCAISSDGAWIATGAKDNEVRLWSAETCKSVLRGVNGHTAEITSLAFNGKQTDSYLLLFSVSSDENLRMWDIGVPLAEQRQQGKKGGGQQSSAAVIEIQHRSGVNAAHSGPIYTVAVAPNDQYVATGGKDKSVNVWNITGKRVFREASLQGHRRGISALAFSPVDRVLASASNDGSVRLWSLVSLTCVKALQVDRTSVLQLGFFNKGTQIVTGNAEGVLRVWAIASSESVWSSEAHTEKIWALAVEERESEQETVFYSGAADGVLIATEDYTAAEVQRVQEDRRETILQEQALANAIRKGEFSEAFMLALRLSHPRHLRQVLVRWCAKDARECEITLRGELLPSLDGDQMTRLLQYTREWITNSRHCMVATLVLYVLISSRHFEEVAKLPSMASLIEPLLAYTRKHSQRQHDLLRRTYYIDYVIRGLAPSVLTSMPPFVDHKEEPLAKRIRTD